MVSPSLRSLFLPWLLVFLVAHVSAQPANNRCANAIDLCAGLAYTVNNYGASVTMCPTCEDGDAGVLFCTQPGNTIWYSFATNGNGGDATVSLQDISCMVAPDFGNGLQLVVIAAATPCNMSSYTAISTCEDSLTNDTDILLTGLTPNTTYYIVLNGNSSGVDVTIPAHCEAKLSVTGQAVEMEADIQTTPEDCAQNDGTIQVTNVAGGQAPYSFSIDGINFQPGGNFTGLSSGSYPILVRDNNGCVHHVDDARVNQSGGPLSVLMVITEPSCNNAQGEILVTNISGGAAPYSFSFNGSPPTPGIVFGGFNSGTYRIRVTDSNGCPLDTVVSIGNQTAIDTLSISVEQPNCGEANGEIVITPVGGQAPYTYNLDGTIQTQETFSNLSPGDYDLLVTDANGCTYTQPIRLEETPQQNAPVVNISTVPSPLCQGQTFTIIAVSQYAGNTPSYEWFVNGISVQTGTDNVLNAPVNDGDEIIVVVTTSGACVAYPTATSSTYTLSPIPVTSPVTTFSVSDNFACEGEPILLTAQTTGCTSGGTYSWMADGVVFATTTENTFTAVFPQSASASVSFQCTDPCSDSSVSNTENIVIENVIADAGPNRHIIQGESTILQGDANGTIEWSPPTNLSSTTIANPTANPTFTTTYTLTVTTPNGCQKTDEVVVIVTPPIEVPNTFTPNGDGVNDTWEIRRIHLYPSSRVTVYTRWGQKVFNTIGYTQEKQWDGTNNGLRLQPGTYFYVIDLNTGNKDFDIVNGSITIVY